MTRRPDRDDPEMIGRVSDLGPLFGAWPEAAPATDEQRCLPIDGTIEGRYQAWRATGDGQAVVACFYLFANEEIGRGATRLSGKFLAERVRARLRLNLNNSFVALLVRDLEADCELVRGLFEKRVRRAS